MHEGAGLGRARADRLSQHRRERDGRPRPPDRAPRGGRAAPLPHLHRRVGGRDPAGEGAGRRGHRRGVAAPPVPDRGGGARPRPGDLQDEPAAAGGLRPGRAGRGARRRHARLHRHRPRAAPRRREGAAVRGSAERGDRAGDGVRSDLHAPGRTRPGAALGRGRADVERPGAGVRPAGAGAAGGRARQPGALEPGRVAAGRSALRLAVAELRVRRPDAPGQMHA